MIKVAVCDDQIDHVRQITKAVHSYFDGRENDEELSIVEFSSAKELNAWIECFGSALDILILDIQLENNADGIDLAKKYTQKYNQIKTIFITGYIEKAAEICEAPLYYRVVVIKAPLQGLCYTVRDAVDWWLAPTTRWF